MNSGNARELHDLVELPLDLRALHPHDRALEVDVLSTGQILVKASGHFNQGTHASPQLTPSLRRAQDFREELQDGGLTRPVRADDPERLAAPRLERNVLERPELVSLQLVLGAHRPLDERRDQIPQRRMALGAAESLPHVLERDARLLHVRRSPRRYIPCDGRRSSRPQT